MLKEEWWMSRAVHLSLTLLALGPLLASAQTPAAEDGDVLAMDARVKIHAEVLGAVPEVGRFAPLGGCLGVWIPDARADQVYTVVPIRLVDRLYVSSIYHARFDPPGPRPIFAPGMDTDGEEWIEVSVERAREQDATCTDPSPPVREVRRGRPR